MEIKLVPIVKTQKHFQWLMAISFLGAAVYFFFAKQNTSVALVLASLAVAVPLLIKSSLSRMQPILVINNYGIFDRRLGVGPIPWGDISGVRIEVTGGIRYLCLQVKSPEKYIAKLSGTKQSKVVAAQDLGFSAFNISVQYLNIDLLDLKNHIEKMMGEHADSSEGVI